MLMQNRSERGGDRGHADNRPARASPFVLLVLEIGLAAYAAISRWFRRWRTRQLLAALEYHQLRDIGLTHPDIWSGRLGEIMAERDRAGLTCRTLPDAGPRTLDPGILRRAAVAELRDCRINDLSEIARKARCKARPAHKYG